MERKSARPDDNGQRRYDSKADISTRAPLAIISVQHNEADDDSPHDGACGREGSIERSGRAVEFSSVYGSLVGVKVVGSKRHGKKRWCVFMA